MTTLRVLTDGTVERGITVPHEAANLTCGQPLGRRRDPESGIEYGLVCKKRAGHHTPDGETPHTPTDTRIKAWPSRIVHGRRFAPSGIPSGVDLRITMPHDCGNHLKDVEAVELGYR